MTTIGPSFTGVGATRRSIANEDRDGRLLLNVHLVDGTYELFRQYYGRLRFAKDDASPYEAAAGVLHSILEMIENGATHIGVATDHVIESFRNDLWADYKTGAGIDPSLWAQFHPLEDALVAMGVVVWPMVDLEADDALAAAARIAGADTSVQRVSIWTPDKDLAQCVRGTRVVQVDRRGGEIRDEAAIRRKFGVAPELIPDYLALVGDAQDGFPGVRGIGKVTAAKLLNLHGALEVFPESVLGERRERALLFKTLATLRAEEPLFERADELLWRGPNDELAAWAQRMDDDRLMERAQQAVDSRERGGRVTT